MNEEVPMMLFDSDMEDEGRILIFGITYPFICRIIFSPEVFALKTTDIGWDT